MPFNNDLGLLAIRVGTGIIFLTRGFLSIFAGSGRWYELGTRMLYFDVQSAYSLWGFIIALLMTLGGLLLIVGLRVRPVAAVLAIVSFLALATAPSVYIDIVSVVYPFATMCVLFGLVLTGGGSMAADTYLTRSTE